MQKSPLRNDRAGRVALLGAGRHGREMAQAIRETSADAVLHLVCDPSFEAYTRIADDSLDAGCNVPAFTRDFGRLLHLIGNGEIDVVAICSPHKYHFPQTKASMEAGADVFCAKPSSRNIREASELIETRDQTGRFLAIAYQGSFSPSLQTARGILASGELGRMQNLFVRVSQNWLELHSMEWRIDPEISGGGFMKDCGAHALNAIALLADNEFSSISALFATLGEPVEINASVTGRLRSDALVTINACGNTLGPPSSEVLVLCSDGMLRTTIWGEYLHINRKKYQIGSPAGSAAGDGWEPAQLIELSGMWDQYFLARNGVIPNPSPPETGLWLAVLWDAITNSAANGGAPVLL